MAGLAVGVWVGNLLEHSIIEREAAAAGMVVESIIEPEIARSRQGADLTAQEIANLDAQLEQSPLADRLRSLRVWSPDGRSSTARTRASSVGTFLRSGTSELAWSGDIVAGMDDLSDPANAWERERWSRLLEMFVPIRERGSDRIIAVAELYLPPRRSSRRSGKRS